MAYLILTRYIPAFYSLCCVITFISGIPVMQNRNTVTRNEDAAFWRKQAQQVITETVQFKLNLNVAKNVVVFLGDGMGVSTVTAARILKGQLKNQPGEEAVLEFENFEYTALIKTYNTDQQTGDSAGTATAFLSGVKTTRKAIGVDSEAIFDDCESQKGHEVDSIMHWSVQQGKSVGVVTTARITHATPAAMYAHASSRYWEADSTMEGITGGCKDIAYQLVKENPNIQVILGGGIDPFYPDNFTGPGVNTTTGSKRRHDGLNLIEAWKSEKENRGLKHEFVYNKGQFDSVNPNTTDYLLGLFGVSHMSYEVDRDDSPAGQPSLTQMTEKAIQILQRNEKGFFLMVEAARIDHAHHDNMAARALLDTLEMDKAVAMAQRLVNSDDTLVVVTADHSHVFTLGGYATRGNPVLGFIDNYSAVGPLDLKPATSLLYANGPSSNRTGPRPNLTDVDTTDIDFMQDSLFPLIYETHAGEDVAVYATGPMAHLFHGVQEQSYMAHAMAYASCVGENQNHCLLKPTSSASSIDVIHITSTILYIMPIWVIRICLNQI